MIKKIAALCMIAAMLFVTSCDSVKEDDPIDAPTMSAYDAYPGLDIEPETDYSNIVAAAEHETYSKDVDKITVIATNYNVGKGFYIHSDKLLQKEKNGRWVNVKYYASPMSDWWFAGVEGNKTEANDFHTYIFPERDQIKFSKGNYRLVLFLPDRLLYANFKIE